MDGRKRLSGSAYRKLAKEKEEREAELKNKIPKISTFFKPQNIEPDPQHRDRPTTSTAMNVDAELEPVSSALFPAIPCKLLSRFQHIPIIYLFIIILYRIVGIVNMNECQGVVSLYLVSSILIVSIYQYRLQHKRQR